MSEAEEESPKSATAEVAIRILDANDNDPNFPEQGYKVIVKEGEGRRPVTKVCAKSQILV